MALVVAVQVPWAQILLTTEPSQLLQELEVKEFSPALPGLKRILEAAAAADRAPLL
jgi:hypothetical protein